MADIDWQFHFRNFYTHEMHVRVHHAGCFDTPWHDGRPACWKKRDLPANTQQGLSSGECVYVPSDWVIHFSDWWAIIKDGLKLIKDIGVMIFEPNLETLASCLADVFAVEKDVVQACIDDLTPEELDELLAKADQSIENSCQSIGMTLDEVKALAKTMGFGDENWGFIAGPTYTRYIHDNDSPCVGKKGWSVFREHDQKGDDDRRIARAAFIEKGHLIYAVDEEHKSQLWSSKW